MASSAQDILRILHGASGFIPDVNGTEYFVVTEESNELSERHWFGSQLASETFIALGIRTNSPAVYAVHDDTRSVFCVGWDNALMLFTLGEDEWHEVHLTGNGNILVHPSGKLSGGVDGSDSLVFFEDLRGRIRGIRVQEDGSWTFLRSLSVDSLPGNPHFAQVQKGIVYLSYLNRDGYIHQMSMGIASNFYDDSRLSGAIFIDTHVANFIVGVQDNRVNEIQHEPRNESRDKPEFYLLALTKKDEEEPEELMCVDGNGKRTVLGRIIHGMFRYMSDKENNRPVIKSASTAVSNATGGGKGGKGGKRR